MSGFVRYIILALLISVVLAGFVFTTFNTSEVPLWLGREFPAKPVGQWVLSAFILGALLGLVLGLGLFRRLKSILQIKRLNARLKDAEKEIAALRKQPLKDMK